MAGENTFANDATYVDTRWAELRALEGLIEAINKANDYKRLKQKYPKMANRPHEELKAFEETENKLKSYYFVQNNDTPEQLKRKQQAFKLALQKEQVRKQVLKYDETVGKVLNWTPLGGLMEAGASLTLRDIGYTDEARTRGAEAAFRIPFDIAGGAWAVTNPLLFTTSTIGAVTGDKVADEVNANRLGRLILTGVGGAAGAGIQSLTNNFVRRFNDSRAGLGSELATIRKFGDLEFVPSYVHESNETDLVRPGKLKDDFYNHTFDINAGDVTRYSEISDFITPIERDVSSLNKSLFSDILQDNVNKGLLSKEEAQKYYSIFDNAKNNIRNYSLLPKEYLDAVVKSIDPNLIDRYSIANDGRIWGTFKVGDRWKGLNRLLNDNSSILYITDARNVPATIAIHEAGHGILSSVGSLASRIDIRNFVGSDLQKIDFLESLSNSELLFFKAQPPSVLELLYSNQNLFKNVPIREVTNIARDIRAMLTSEGIKTKELLYKYIKEISDDELYNMYPLTKYLLVMRENTSSKKEYVDFLKKLITGTAFAAPFIISTDLTEAY